MLHLGKELSHSLGSEAVVVQKSEHAIRVRPSLHLELPVLKKDQAVQSLQDLSHVPTVDVLEYEFTPRMVEVFDFEQFVLKHDPLDAVVYFCVFPKSRIADVQEVLLGNRLQELLVEGVSDLDEPDEVLRIQSLVVKPSGNVNGEKTHEVHHQSDDQAHQRGIVQEDEIKQEQDCLDLAHEEKERGEDFVQNGDFSGGEIDLSVVLEVAVEESEGDLEDVEDAENELEGEDCLLDLVDVVEDVSPHDDGHNQVVQKVDDGKLEHQFAMLLDVILFGLPENDVDYCEVDDPEEKDDVNDRVNQSEERLVIHYNAVN